MNKNWKTEDYVIKKYNRHKEVRDMLKLHRMEYDKPKRKSVAINEEEED